MPNCARCRCDKVFHQVGRGTGVPVGQHYCDDRHSDCWCHCIGFIVEKPATQDTELNYPTSSFNFRHAEICRAALSYNGEPLVLYCWMNVLTSDQVNNEMIEVVW